MKENASCQADLNEQKLNQIFSHANFTLNTNLDNQGRRVRKQLSNLVKKLHKNFPQLVLPTTVTIENDSVSPTRIEARYILADNSLDNGTRGWILEDQFYLKYGPEIVNKIGKFARQALEENGRGPGKALF